jgi:hypothetical protein
MQVTSLLSREEEPGHKHTGPDCGCGHEHAPVRLWQTLIGVVFVINAFIVDWLFDHSENIASGSAFIGAIILTLSYSVPFFGIFAWAMATVFGLGGAIVALSNSFKSEERNVQPAPVLVSTLRPVGQPANPLAGAAASAHTAAGGTTAVIPPFIQNASELNPQDTLLLPRAGFWKRFLAAMLDLFLLSVAVAVIV